MKYHIWIIGCQYNEWDGARLNFLMQKLGFTESKPEEADVIIILACSVRQTAIDRILGRVKNWQPKAKPKDQRIDRSKNFDETAANESKQPTNNLAIKQFYNFPLILVSGCVLEADKPKFTKKGIKFFESGDIKELVRIIKKDPSTSLGMTSATTNNLAIKQFNNSSAFVPIMVGCNNFCSYCAVPYTRGREKSRPIDEVIHDVKELVAKGNKEVMLLGQNVNSYTINQKNKTKNQKTKSDFAILLKELNNLDGDFVISFTSNHPKDMTNDIIDAVATLPKIKKQLHLPIQSGSNKILKLMNRPYTVEQYLRLIENCKLKIDNLIITTDVIVGFPGETEEDFQETVRVFKLVDYDVAYINKYSSRKGTKAYEMGDPISWDEKKRRWKILDDLANKPGK